HARLECAGRRETLDRMIRAVGDVDRAGAIDGHAARHVETGVARSEGADGEDRLAVHVEDIDSVVELVDNVDAIAGGRDVTRDAELAGSGTHRAERAEIPA